MTGFEQFVNSKEITLREVDTAKGFDVLKWDYRKGAYGVHKHFATYDEAADFIKSSKFHLLLRFYKVGETETATA